MAKATQQSRKAPTQSTLNGTAVVLDKLEAHLWETANILRGPVDAADFKTYVFPLLFFKRISDVHDEEYAAALAESDGDEEYARFPQNYRFQIPDDCHWDDVRQVARNVGQALQKAMRGIERANPETLYGIFGDASWTNKDRLPDSLLRDLIEHFSRINLGNKAAQSDVLGQSYEYLIKKFADATNKKAGEFYTPRSVVRLMVNILDPGEGETIYDPACGTGGMLLEAIHHVKENHGDDRTLWGRLFGQEKNLTTSAIARMNLFLHGAADFQIVRGDTLRNPAFFLGDNLATFDCVIANPPFSLEKWGDEVWTSDPFGRNFAGMPPGKSGDYAWVQHMIKSMAVAEFDAVVSGDIYLLAPKGDRLLPELLPFLCLSDRFFQHAVGTSAGSLSPRTNWSSLANFEFDLPPLDQQRRIAEILWAVDESLARHGKVRQDLDALRTSVSESALRGNTKTVRLNGDSWSSWPIKRVEEVCERISVGIVITPSKYYRPTGVRCFRSANVRRGFIEDKDWIFISEEAHKMHSKSIVRAGDVLVVRSGVFAGMSCTVPPEYDGINCIDVVFATPRPEVVESEWLSNFINSSFGQVEIKRGERGLAQKHFGVDAMRNTPLPLPPIGEQRRQLAKLKDISDAIVLTRKHSESLRSSSAAFISTVFS